MACLAPSKVHAQERLKADLVRSRIIKFSSSSPGQPCPVRSATPSGYTTALGAMNSADTDNPGLKTCKPAFLTGTRPLRLKNCMKAQVEELLQTQSGHRPPAHLMGVEKQKRAFSCSSVKLLANYHPFAA